MFTKVYYHNRLQLSTVNPYVKMLRMEFGDWLQEQIQKRDLTYEELAERSTLSKSYISLVISGQRKVTRNFCVKIAAGLEIDQIYVLSKAGLITTPEKLDDKIQEILEIIKRLSDDKRKTVLRFTKFLAKEPD